MDIRSQITERASVGLKTVGDRWTKHKSGTIRTQYNTSTLLSYVRTPFASRLRMPSACLPYVESKFSTITVDYS